MGDVRLLIPDELVPSDRFIEPSVEDRFVES